MNAFLSGLESSGWMRHVKTVLEASAFIAEVNTSINYSQRVSINHKHRLLIDFIN